MRKLTFLALSLILSLPVLAQPVRNALTGTILLEEDQAKTELQLSDFKYIPQEESNTGMIGLARTEPGLAFLYSGIIPGSGQAINGKWGRAAIYFLIDAASAVYYFNRNNTAKDNEASYERYANENWSSIAYAQWLVEYSRANNIPNGYQDLETHLIGKSPDFGNTTSEWMILDINIVRDVESKTTYYYSNGNIKSNFSHELQDYGSQQYYELMSKYYQFQPGWEDFYTIWTNDSNHDFRYTWNAEMLTPNFIEGRDRAEEFNNNYRQAGNILKLMLVNHVVSAFDAFFTVKLKNSRIETQANLLRPDSFSVIFHF